MISPGLYQRVSTYPALAAIGDNWFPGGLPEGADLPAGIYTCISRVRIFTQDGGGPFDTRYQLDIYSEDFDECEALINALDKAMHGYRGTITVGGVDYVIKASLFDNGLGPNLQPTGRRSDGPEPGFFRATHDYKIFHSEVT